MREGGLIGVKTFQSVGLDAHLLFLSHQVAALFYRMPPIWVIGNPASDVTNMISSTWPSNLRMSLLPIFSSRDDRPTMLLLMY